VKANAKGVSELAIGCRFPSAHGPSPGSVTGLACEIYTHCVYVDNECRYMKSQWLLIVFEAIRGSLTAQILV
jgi:hypothetical protein